MIDPNRIDPNRIDADRIDPDRIDPERIDTAWLDIALSAIEGAFLSSEGMAYLGEHVTMVQHQLQAAELAAGSSDEFVVASLLHDIGHMVSDAGAADASAALADERDAHHDASGARWLSQWFGSEVTEPVRLHVAAKRYLVSTEPGYAARLSEASVHTLRLQGGPMSAAEIDDFERLDFAQQAVALRRLDEGAKDASRDAPGLEAHREILVRVLHREARRRSLA
jgi:gamma-butyrobetaine dioxygenase